MRRRKLLALVGGAVAWPAAINAQQSSTPVIGLISGRSAEDSVNLVAAFHQGLQELGFVEGQNVTVLYDWARGDYSRLPALAAELVARRVNVLLAVGGGASARAAKAATATIPIVFIIGGDPVKDGLANSFNRPGGNSTGCTILTGEIEPKRLGLLQELVPNVGVYGALLNPSNALAARQFRDLEDAARKIGKRIFAAHARNDAELTTAFAALSREQVSAMLFAADPFFDTSRGRLIAFAAQHRIPTIYPLREYAVNGGLISYGPSVTDSYRWAGIYVGRILTGVKPSDLPIVQPTKFELIVNLKTANAHGLTIPQSILLRADEVID